MELSQLLNKSTNTTRTVTNYFNFNTKYVAYFSSVRTVLANVSFYDRFARPTFNISLFMSIEAVITAFYARLRTKCYKIVLPYFDVGEVETVSS